ncbi:MAG TPA: DUF2344 domain-containing protein, partial [Jiangellaceae bacterium]|nr:DUF2344 domain-containing protein [Jiangellaceae bacterium]
DLPGVDQGRLSRAVSALLAASSVEVRRMTKNGSRMLDARAAVVRLEVRADGTSLRAVLRHQTPTVRPDDLLVALRLTGEGVDAQPFLSTRLAQGPLDEESAAVGDPFGGG